MSQSRDEAGVPRRTGIQNVHWLWLSALVILIDQVAKQLMANHFALFESMRLTGWLNLTLVHNTGAAFSILRGSTPWLFVALSVVVVIGILFWMRRHPYDSRLLAVALSLIAGGALGNAIGRATRGFVVDFIDFHIGTWHYPTFNFADCAIVGGAILIALEMLLVRRYSAR